MPRHELPALLVSVQGESLLSDNWPLSQLRRASVSRAVLPDADGEEDVPGERLFSFQLCRDGF